VVIFAGAAVALAASSKMLVPIMLLSQVINGVLLPVIIFFMLKITSDKTIMGAHVNSRGFNIVAWSGAIITASISIIMVVMTLIQ
jgi:Mn2+/Fe2+ NRAMP family transporter